LGRWRSWQPPAAEGVAQRTSLAARGIPCQHARRFLPFVPVKPLWRDGLDVVDERTGRTIVHSAFAQMTLSDGSVYRLHGPTAKGDSKRPGLGWVVSPISGGLALALVVYNRTSHPISIERLDVLVAGAESGGLEVAQTGWQSRSVATSPLPLPEQLSASPAHPMFGYSAPPTEAHRMLAPHATLLRWPDRHMLVGFSGAKKQAGVVALQPGRLTASSYLEGVQVAPGHTVHSETLLLLQRSSERESWLGYAEAAAKSMGARLPGSVPAGWCSCSPPDLVANLEKLHSWPLSVVQLGERYVPQIGDWLQDEQLQAHAARIRAAGFSAGTWLAPFVVSERSEVFRQHPDWVLRDLHDEPVHAVEHWDTRNFALDLTHPEVLAWLQETTRVLVGDWGFEYLKLDFLWVGALRGKRADRTSTSVAAYRRGLEAVRNGAGTAFLIGAGAPYLPSVGLLDAVRTGPDTARNWKPKLSGAGPAKSLFYAIRSAVAHWWMHRTWWLNHPDVLLAAEADQELSEDEIRSWASVVALSGGVVMFGDELQRLPAERGALLQRLLPPLGVAPVPGLAQVKGVPTQLLLRHAERTVVGLFNWEDRAANLTFEPESCGVAGPYHLIDLWAGTHQGPQTGPVELPRVPAHGVRLLAVILDAGRPQVLATTLHALGGLVELGQESWSAGELELPLRLPGARRGEVLLFVERLIRVPVEFTDEMTLRWPLGV
jgi:alpha-galactosidase